MMKLRITLLTIFCIINSIFAQQVPDIFNKPSKKDLAYKARDVLMESLSKGDSANARTALEYLQANIDNGAPLTKHEEFKIYFELGDYENGILVFEDIAHSDYDTTYKNSTDFRISAEDNLKKFLDLIWGNSDSDNYKDFYDSLIREVNQSSIEQKYKDLFSTLISLKNIDQYNLKYNNISNSKDSLQIVEFLDRAEKYCNKYPTTNTSFLLKEQVIPLIKNFRKKDETHKQDPLISKYYTGGFSIYVGKWYGLLSGDITKYMKNKIGNTFIFEGEIQVYRVALNGAFSMGMITNPKYDEKDYSNDDDGNFALSLGYVTYDSRFFKTTPFIGVGTMYFQTKGNLTEPLLVLGANIDSHLLFTNSFKNEPSIGINARFKYMMQIGKFNSKNDKDFDEHDTQIKATMISHTFALELGVLIW